MAQFTFAVIDQHGALLQKAQVQPQLLAAGRHNVATREALAREFRKSNRTFKLPMVLHDDQPGSLVLEWHSPSGSGGSANLIWRGEVYAHVVLLAGLDPKAEQIYLNASAITLERFAVACAHPFDRLNLMSISERPTAIMILIQRGTAGVNAMLGLTAMIALSALLEAGLE